jgi:hypothetical protein
MKPIWGGMRINEDFEDVYLKTYLSNTFTYEKAGKITNIDVVSIKHLNNHRGI